MARAYTRRVAQWQPPTSAKKRESITLTKRRYWAGVKSDWKPCTFSWWAHFETPPDLFYAVAQQRAREQAPESTT